jgi:SWIM/SEC-C metal-binding protein
VAKLGSDKRPAVIRVRSVARAEEIVAYCDERGWKVIVGIEPQETEDLTDLEKLNNGAKLSMSTTRSEPSIGRNEPCPCGSGKKFKKCCGRDNTGVGRSDR